MSEKPQKQATINDVAAAAGVSKKTVSRVINQSPLVNGRTRQRVLDVIALLRYVPNLQARSLASRRSFLLGFWYDNPNAEYVSDLQSGVLMQCQQRGFELLVRQCDNSSPDLVSDMVRLVERVKLDGVVILPPMSERDDLAHALRAVGCEYVRIGAVTLDAPGRYINCQDRDAAAQMAAHLAGLGHRRIGFVRGPRGYKSAAERAKGFRDGLRKAGLQLERRYTAQGAYTFESGLSCARRLLDMPEPPTAIFASNDQMASGVLRVANERSLSVPADVAIAGFDDGAVAARSWPPLTTVRQPVVTAGELAAMMLVRPDSGGAPTPDTIDPELVIRASTAGF